MKYDFQISTGQFEFIHGEVEGTPEDAVMAFKALKRAYEGGSGLPAAQFNSWLDTYLAGKAGSSDEWEQMSDAQKVVINEIKKSKKRNTN